MSAGIVYSDEACAMGTVGNVVVMVWRGEPTDARLAKGFDVLVPHAARCGTKVGVVTVIEEGAPPPALSQRIPFLRELASRSDVLAALVMVLEEGRSGWRSTVLEVATSMAGTLKLIPVKLCVGTKEASTWIVARAGEVSADAPSREELREAIELVRAAIRDVG